MLDDLSLLVKPAGADCPLSCSYCFYRSSGPRGGRMSEETLRLLTGQALSSARRVTFVWQGGEPALMGRAFYERAVQLQQELAGPGQVVQNALQTSGVGMGPGWIELLREGDFLVGLSIDGDQALHEASRGPSWERAVETARWMFEAAIPVNALSVVAAGGEHSARQRYTALRELGFEHLQFLPVVDPDPEDAGRPGPSSVDPKAWAAFLLELWEAWWPEHRKVSVRNFDELLASYVGAPPVTCTTAERCGSYLVVEHDGGLHRCDFLVDPAHPIAQLGQRPLPEVLRSPAQRALGDTKAALPEPCQSCTWRPRCHGGCPYHRYGPSGLSHLCEAYRGVLEGLDPKLRQLARQIRPARPTRRNEPCPCGSGLKFKRCCATLPASGPPRR